MTNEAHIKVARQVAEQILLNVKGLSSCSVDDWDNSQGFRLFASMKGAWGHGIHGYFIPEGETLAYKSKRSAVRSISAQIRSILRKHKLLSDIFTVVPPKGKYSWSLGLAYFEGYDSNTIQIDLTVVLDCEKVYI